MDMQELKQLIYKGEKVDVECKKAENNVPKSVYESYSAFANTKGDYMNLNFIRKVFGFRKKTVYVRSGLIGNMICQRLREPILMSVLIRRHGFLIIWKMVTVTV